MSDKFPDVIYLQIHEADDIYFDGQITWCQDKIDDTDVKYIRADTVGLRNRHTKETIEEEATLKERERIVEVLKQKYLKRSAITDLKSLHFAMAYEEIINLIERKSE